MLLIYATEKERGTAICFKMIYCMCIWKNSHFVKPNENYYKNDSQIGGIYKHKCSDLLQKCCQLHSRSMAQLFISHYLLGHPYFLIRTPVCSMLRQGNMFWFQIYYVSFTLPLCSLSQLLCTMYSMLLTMNCLPSIIQTHVLVNTLEKSMGSDSVCAERCLLN